jgi:WD40 repeat protein
MKTVDYWKEKGFIEIGSIFSSDRLKQGVDVNFIVEKEDWNKQPGVYLICSNDGTVLKIGQSANVYHRINTQYKCISNSGNIRIRESIKSDYNLVKIYAFKTPKQKVCLLDYSFYINYQKGLEEAMLHDYFNKVGDIPALNMQRN